MGVAREWAAKWQAVVVLKGAFTAIAEPALPSAGGPQRDGLVRLSPFANPGLASGGTGDVLTGIIGSLLAQGMDAFRRGQLRRVPARAGGGDGDGRPGRGGSAGLGGGGCRAGGLSGSLRA